MNLRNTIVPLVALGLFVAASGAKANLLSNSSFETYDTSMANGSGPSYYTYNAGNAGIADWKVGLTSVDTVTSFYPVYDGLSAVDLAGTPGPGSVSQDVATVIGQQYLVSVYAMATSLDGQNNFVTMSLGGDSHTFQITGAFQQYSFLSTATSSTSTYALSTLLTNNTNGNCIVDAASIQSVPEPMSMSFLGLGVAALIRRRRAAK